MGRVRETWSWCVTSTSQQARRASVAALCARGQTSGNKGGRYGGRHQLHTAHARHQPHTAHTTQIIVSGNAWRKGKRKEEPGQDAHAQDAHVRTPENPDRNGVCVCVCAGVCV